MQEVHVERLRELYAMLAGLPDERVNLNEWRRGKNGEANPLKVDITTSCGTIACAVGWACSYPPFNAQGLSWKASGLSDIRGLPTYSCPGGGSKGNWDAVCAFFGVNYETANALFSPSCRSFDGPEEFTFGDRQKVMRRIRRFLMQEGHITADRNAELAQQEGTLP